jgi:hypothetical protein
MASVAQSLIERLGRHYVPPGRGGGLFVPEVGTNDGGATGSRCDAIYVGFTSSSGRILIGHEVKTSRPDWLHELDQPGKADFWHDNTHAWYVVAPAPSIVRVEELPPGWGLLLPNPRSRVRFDVAVKAEVRRDLQPSWLAVRSVMARLDTLHQQAVDSARADGAVGLLEPVVQMWRKKSYRPTSGHAAVDRLIAELVELAIANDRSRRARFGGTTVGDLLDRITERLRGDGAEYDADPDAIVEAIADHAAVTRTARQLRDELQQRAMSASRLIAALPEHLAGVIALGDEQQTGDEQETAMASAS